MTSSSTPAVTVAQLRSFLAILSSGSVRQAARQLVVTESAVSAAATSLSRQIGVPLLERHGRGVRCSAAGDAFAPYARQVLGLLSEGAAAATGSGAPERGLLRIAAVTTAAEQLLPHLLAGFRTEHPAVSVHLQVADSRAIWAAFTSHEVDLVLAGRPPADVGGAVTRARRGNLLVAVAAPQVAADPATSTWLMREPGSGIRSTLEALLEGQDLHPPLLHMGSSGAVIAGAVAGLGLALVSQEAVRDLLASGALREVALKELPLRRPWHVVTRSALTPTTRLFVRHLLQDPGSPFRRR